MPFSELLKPDMLQAIQEIVADDITPEEKALNQLSDHIAASLAKRQRPVFDIKLSQLVLCSPNEAAALWINSMFSTKQIEIWIDWMAKEIARLSDNQVTLQVPDTLEQSRTKGLSITMMLSSAADDKTYHLVEFGPYDVPVELTSRNF